MRQSSETGAPVAQRLKLPDARHIYKHARRISALPDKRIYIPGKSAEWPTLAPLIGGSLNLKLMEQQFDEFIRLVASIKQGTVTASLILHWSVYDKPAIHT